MPLVVKDRVRETTTTLGTGTITLAGAVAGFQSFSAIGNANTTYYTINLPGANEWEVGIGTYTASGTTLSRDTILASSNGGSAVNFSAGTKDVFCTYPAGKSAYLDASNNLLIGTTTNTNTSNIVANGTISETVSSTQYLVASQFDVGTNPNQIPLNQYLGDMAFQSSAGVSVGALTASGAVTLSGGTANGVVYLNASKVATTSSGFTYNGSTTLNLNNSGNATYYCQSASGSIAKLDLTQSGVSSYTISTGSADALIFARDGAERMRLTSTGTLNIVGAGTAGSTQAISFNGSTPVDTLVTTSGGNVGIGTNAPVGKLQVSGANDSRVALINGATKGVRFNIGSSGSSIEGVDNTGAGSFQPLTIGGSTVNFSISGSDKAYLDSSGNLGLGVTPSAWSSSVATQVGYGAALSSRAAGNTASDVTHGAYWNGTNWLYQHGSVGAARYQMTGANAGSTHAWFVSAGGTAGDAISFTQAMTLDADGDLGIGTTSPAYKLDVSGSVIRLNNSGSTADIFLTDSGTTNGHVRLRGESNAMKFITGNGISATLDSSGNLGLGVTPSAWGNGVSMQGSGWSLSTLLGTDQSGFYTNARQTAYGSLNSNWVYRTTAAAVGYAQATGSHAWLIAPSGTAGNAISFTQAMTLDANGNLALGNTSVITGARADIRGANSNNLSDLDAQVLTVFDTTNYAQNVGGGIAFGYKFNSSNSYIQRAAVIKAVKENSTDGNYASAMVFATTANAASTTERARITSGGDFLVGTNTSIGVGGLTTVPNNSAGAPSVFWNRTATASTSTAVQFRDGGTAVGEITYTNTATAYVTSSDYRLKNTIAPMTGALAKVAALKPVTYKWKADGSDGEGFIAHELQAVVPQCVTGEKDAVDAEGKPIYQGIDTSFLVATLTAAIQEQQAMINELKAEVAALKGA